MNELTGEIPGKVKMKLGRRPKDQRKIYEINEDQTKFIMELSDQKNELQMIFNLLLRANQKDYGREIIFKDLVLLALPKLNDKDLEKLQECSLTGMEKVARALDLYNKKNNTHLKLDEYLLLKLGIN
jgi:endonuclease III